MVVLIKKEIGGDFSRITFSFFPNSSMEGEDKVKYRKKNDTSTVHRLRFTENELKLILESVGFYADYLSQAVYPKVKAQWDQLVKENMRYHEQVLHERWLGVKPGDPSFEDHAKVDGQIKELKTKVDGLNLVERQLNLDFKLIDSKTPQWQLTFKRIMHT